MAEAENQHVEARAIAKRLQDHPSINPHVDELTYKEMYKESIENPDKFWGAVRVQTGQDGADAAAARARDAVVDAALRDGPARRL